MTATTRNGHPRHVTPCPDGWGQKKLLGAGAQSKKPKEAKMPKNPRQTKRKPPFEYSREQSRWTAGGKNERWGTKPKPPPPAPKHQTHRKQTSGTKPDPPMAPDQDANGTRAPISISTKWSTPCLRGWMGGPRPGTTVPRHLGTP